MALKKQTKEKIINKISINRQAGGPGREESMAQAVTDNRRY